MPLIINRVNRHLLPSTAAHTPCARMNTFIFTAQEQYLVSVSIVYWRVIDPSFAGALDAAVSEVSSLPTDFCGDGICFDMTHYTSL